MSEQPKLEPCPFCGGAADIVEVVSSEIIGFRPGCNDRRCPGCGRGAIYPTRPMAARAWNRRAPALPALNDDLNEILGTVCFRAGPIAHAFVKAGEAKIKAHAEEEQAFVIHWLLGLYLKHGSGWRKVAGEKLQEVVAKAKAAAE